MDGGSSSGPTQPNSPIKLCTLTREENGAVVEAFLRETSSSTRGPMARSDRPPAAVRPLLDAEGFLRCLPHVHGTDGFFAARLERRP